MQIGAVLNVRSYNVNNCVLAPFWSALVPGARLLCDATLYSLRALARIIFHVSCPHVSKSLVWVRARHLVQHIVESVCLRLRLRAV